MDATQPTSTPTPATTSPPSPPPTTTTTSTSTSAQPQEDPANTTTTPPPPPPPTANEPHATHIHCGVKFVAGKLEFSFTALPPDTLYTLRMFAAARSGDLEQLTSIVESSRSLDFAVPYVTISQTDNTTDNRFSTISVASSQGLDVNVEYQPPTYSDDIFGGAGSGFARRRSSVYAVRNVTLFSPLSPSPNQRLGSPGPGGGGGGGGGGGMAPAGICSLEDYKLLLHVAIGRSHLEMVSYLLSQGADVSYTGIVGGIVHVCWPIP